ncbi:MAG: response regulator [Sedimentisphaerales bacterium]|nr:response regulator [Sedimentisphaerales bacterium]
MHRHRSDPCGQRVLIVDDEMNLRRTLAEILHDEGFEVTTAATGEEAVRLCAESRFEVVLMDVRMPGMDGVEAFRRIRRHQERTRVILMSAFSGEDLKETALDEGAVAFLSKPLDLDQVVSLVGETNDTAILVVEDDSETAHLLRESLSRHGYRVTLVTSPHDALELVEQIRFNLTFLDANLPTMNGLELYLAIRKIIPSSVTIMVAGQEQEFERIAREAVRRNACAVIHKPLDVDHVLRMLDRMAGRQVSGDNRKPPLPESW